MVRYFSLVALNHSGNSLTPNQVSLKSDFYREVSVKKKYSYNEKAGKFCRAVVGITKGMKIYCNKPLKKRLVETKASHNITHCYNHQPKETISGHSKRGRS